MNKIANKKKAGFRAGLVITLVIGMLFTIQNVSIQQDKDTRSWHIVWEGNMAQAAEANPGAGAGGILEIYFYPHAADPATTYTENTTATIEAACTAAGLGYASADNFNTELAHSVAFDVVVRVRGNKTQCWRLTKFFDSDLKVEWTSADLSIGADTAMTGVISYNNTGQDYLWMNFYDNNGHAGFTLAKDGTAQITSIKLSAYF
jgi:hypothetical protein